MCGLATRAAVLAYSVPVRDQTDNPPGHRRLKRLTPLGKERCVASSLEGEGVRLKSSGLFLKPRGPFSSHESPWLSSVFWTLGLKGRGRPCLWVGSICIDVVAGSYFFYDSPAFLEPEAGATT